MPLACRREALYRFDLVLALERCGKPESNCCVLRAFETVYLLVCRTQNAWRFKMFKHERT